MNLRFESRNAQLCNRSWERPNAKSLSRPVNSALSQSMACRRRFAFPASADSRCPIAAYSGVRRYSSEGFA